MRLTATQAILQRQATSPEDAAVWAVATPLETVIESEALPARDIILTSVDTKTPCTPQFGSAFCSRLHEKRIAYGCSSRRCTSRVCRNHARAERSHQLHQFVKDCFPHDKWGKIVLTYHPELLERLKDRRLHAAARAAAQAMVESFFLDAAHLEEGWRLGMVSVDHPCGDGDDQEEEGVGGSQHQGHVDSLEWFPHHNFVFPLKAFGPTGRAVLAKTDEVTGEVSEASKDSSRRRTLSAWIDVDELRSRWRALQEEMLGRPLEGDVNLWYGYAATEPAKLKMLNYFPRGFPAWPGKAQRLSYYGVFGCQVLHTIRESEKLQQKSESDRVACDCGAPFIRVQMDAGGRSGLTRGIPHGYRLMTVNTS